VPVPQLRAPKPQGQRPLARESQLLVLKPQGQLRARQLRTPRLRAPQLRAQPMLLRPPA
jgi:hypothetical protein